MSIITILVMTVTGLLALAGIIQLMHLGGAGIRPGRMVFAAGAIMLTYFVLAVLMPDPAGPYSSILFGLLLFVAYLVVLTRERRRYRRWRDYKPEETARDRRVLKIVLPLLSFGYVLAISVAVLGGGPKPLGTGPHPSPKSSPGASALASQVPLPSEAPIVLGPGETIGISLRARGRGRVLVTGTVSPANMAHQIVDPTFNQSAPYTWTIATAPLDPDLTEVLASGAKDSGAIALSFSRIMPCASLVSDGGRLALTLRAGGHIWQNFNTPPGLADACPVPSLAGPVTATSAGGNLNVTADLLISAPPGFASSTVVWRASLVSATASNLLASAPALDRNAFTVTFALSCAQAKNAVVRVDLNNQDGLLGWVTISTLPTASCGSASPSSRPTPRPSAASPRP